MEPSAEELFSQEIMWSLSDDPDFRLVAKARGISLKIRVNSMPGKPLYTLFINEKEMASFERWPRNWLYDVEQIRNLRRVSSPTSIKLPEIDEESRQYIQKIIEWEKESAKPRNIVYRWPKRFREHLAKRNAKAQHTTDD